MSESQVDPVVLEIPRVRGNNGRGPGSSTPVSPFCNLKWLIRLAQANQTSFLLTKTGLLSLSVEGASPCIYSKSPMVPAAKASTLPQDTGVSWVLFWELPIHTLTALPLHYSPKLLLHLNYHDTTTLTQTPSAQSRHPVLFVWCFHSTVDHS